MQRTLATLLTICFSFGTSVQAQEAKPLPSANRCIAYLCGSFSSADFEKIKRPAAHLKRIDQDYHKLVRPLIELEIKQTVREKLQTFELLDFLSTADVSSVVFSDDLKLQLNMKFIFELFLKLIEEEAVTDSSDLSTFKIIREKALQVAEKEKILDPEGAIEGTEALNEIGIFRLINQSSVIKLSTLHKVEASNMSYPEFLKMMFSFFDVWDDRLQKLNPFRPPQRSYVRQKYANGGIITDADSEAFMWEYIAAYLTANAMSPGRLNLSLKNLKRDYHAEFRERLQVLRELKPDVIAQLSGKKFASRIGEINRVCADQYKTKMRSFPTTEEVKLFQSNYVPSVTKAAVRVLENLGFNHLIDKVKSLHWKTPLEYGEATKSMVALLKDERMLEDEWRQAQGLTWQKMRSGDQSALAWAITSILGASEADFIDALSAVQEGCELVSPESELDSIYTNAQIVNVGWRTVLKPATAPFTMAHEIGHLVYDSEEKSPALSKKLECLEKRHRGLEEDPKKYLEEDFSDLFAAAVEKEYSKNRGSNLLCFTRPNPKEKISLGLSSLTQYDTDTHSTGLFRLIMSSVEHGMLPNSCKATLKEAKIADDFEQCWNK